MQSMKQLEHKELINDSTNYIAKTSLDIKEAILNTFKSGSSENENVLVGKYNVLLNFIGEVPSLSKALLGNILTARNTNRTKGFILEENINKYLKVATPGDILLSRSDGYYSNAIIKGFWKHMALYAGKGKDLKDKYPLDKDYIQDDEDYIMEVTTLDGVQLKSIKEYSKNNDYLGVFTLDIGEDKNKKNIEEGLKHIGKKYDYLINLNENEKMFCSQLPLEIHKKELKPSVLNFGFVKTFLPNAFIEYALENREKVKPKFFIDNDEGQNILNSDDELFLSGTRSSYGIDYKKDSI